MQQNATLVFDNDTSSRSIGKHVVKPDSGLDLAANLVPVESDQSTVSPRKSRNRYYGRRKRTRDSVELSPDDVSSLTDNLTSSPKKYINVMNKVLPSPESMAIKDKLMSLAKDTSDPATAVTLNGDACLSPKPSISHAWDQLFQSVHSNDAKPKLAVSKQEASAWDSLFETMNTSSSAVVVYSQSDGEDSEDELKITIPNELEIDAQPVEVGVHKTPQSPPKEKPHPEKLQRTYGSYRSYRANVDSDDSKHEVEEDFVDTKDSVANINDLRSITKNSQIQEEIDELLQLLKGCPTNNSFLLHTLIELAFKLQQSDRNYLDSHELILSRIEDVSNQFEELNINADLIKWLIAVINYYYFWSGIFESVNVPSILIGINVKPKAERKLSNSMQQRLNELRKNVPANTIIALNVVRKLNESPLINQESIFKALSDLFDESSEQLRTEILIYFEKYLESLSSPSNMTIIPRVISEFMNQMRKNSFTSTDLHCAKLLVIMTSKFPDIDVVDSMFCGRFVTVSLDAINRIYEGIQSKSSNATQESMAVLLLGYLLNYIETKRWEVEDIGRIHKNIELIQGLPRRDTVHVHMAGYNSLILGQLTLQKQVSVDKWYLIRNLEQFKSVIENPGIVEKIDTLINDLS